jgi:hypothetical protein
MQSSDINTCCLQSELCNYVNRALESQCYNHLVTIEQCMISTPPKALPRLSLCHGALCKEVTIANTTRNSSVKLQHRVQESN